MVSGSGAGCWDVEVDAATLARGGVVMLVKASTPSTPEGVTSSYHPVPRGTSASMGAIAFTVATPANDASTMPVVNLTVHGVNLKGAACTPGVVHAPAPVGVSPDGGVVASTSVSIVMPVNSSAGASTTVTCTVITATATDTDQ